MNGSKFLVPGSWFVFRFGSGFLFLFTFVFLFAAVMAAQDVAPLRLSLAEAQARAREASHRLAELQAREVGAQATVDARTAATKPNVAFVAGYTRTNHITPFSVIGGPPVSVIPIYPDVPDNYRTRVDLQWPIFSGGRSDALIRAAQAEASAINSDLVAARADLQLEVARAYWALVTARANVAVVDQALARTQSHLDDVRSRLSAGLIPPNEVASAEAQLARQRLFVIEAGSQRDMSSADLARLIGESIVRPIEPSEPLEASAADGGSGSPAARPERRAIELRIDAATERQTAAMAGKRPTVGVGGGFDYARPNPRIFPRAARWEDSWDATVNLTWPLWDGGRSTAELAEASAATSAARQRLAEFDSIATLEIRQRQLELTASRAAVDAAGEGSRAAEEARRVVTERYTAGVIAHGEVLDAQVSLLQAELDRTRALANVRLAEARLARAEGR